MPIPYLSYRCKGTGGFSLVEVVLAIGVVSFSMTTILALLPVGLTTLKDTSDRDGVTQIIQQVRADLDQIPFTSTGPSSVAIDDLPNQKGYYSRTGGLMPSAANAYFATSYAVASPVFPGSTASITSVSRVVTVTISYPIQAVQPKTKVFSLLITKQ